MLNAAEILRLEQVSYTYDSGSPLAREVLRGIDLVIRQGETIALMGASGSGKTTLAQHLNGLLRPTEGRVFWENRDIWADKKRIPQVRFQVGLAFQYPEYQLFAKSVGEDVAFGPRMMGLSSDEVAGRVRRALAFAGWEADFAGQLIQGLSTGQKRRVALAGVMAMEPRVLVLDEPTAGLDPRTGREILDRLQAYRQKEGATLVLVTHDIEEVAASADRVLVLKEGRIALDTPPEALFREKRSEEELSALGLQVPLVTKLMQGLAERGLPVDPGILTADQAARALQKLWEAKGG